MLELVAGSDLTQTVDSTQSATSTPIMAAVSSQLLYCNMNSFLALSAAIPSWPNEPSIDHMILLMSTDY